jgi:hypothetical protein
MPLATDTPDTMAQLWAKAEAKAEAFEATVEAKNPAAKAKPAEAASPPDGEAPANDTAEPAADAKEPAKAKPEAEKPKQKPLQPAPEDQEEEPGEREQFEALAKKFGYAVDANKVTVNERVKWREDVRKERSRLAEREQAFTSKVAEVEQNLQTKFGRGARACEAWDRGDFDALAKALAEDDKVGWRDLQNKAKEKILSPEHRRIAEMEERERKREQAEREREEQAEREAEQQKLQRGRIAYQQKLVGSMAASEDRVLKALATQPQFVGAMMSVIEREYHETGEEVSPQDALHKPFGDGTLLDNAKALWQSLNAAFGDPATMKQEAPSGVGNRGAEDSARPGKKPKTLSRNGAAEVSARGQYKDETDFVRQWAKRIAEADD